MSWQRCSNTLFLSTDGTWAGKEHDTIVIRVENQPKRQIPLLHLSSIVCLARVTISPELMQVCLERNIHISFFAPWGRFWGRVEGIPGGNVLLRRQQYRMADQLEASLSISRAMITGKIFNARQFLLHARRDAAEARKGELAFVCERLQVALRGLATVGTLDELRGVEGNAAREYFAAFPLVLKRSEEAFRFEGRTRHPPRDRINALLSFGYAILMQDCAGALAGVGLDPAVGFLHEDRPGRLSLALDLMEELRTPLVDRLVVSLVNRMQIQENDLHEEASGAWRLTDEARKRFLLAYQEAKQVSLRHEFLEQDIVWGQVPHLQALLLARTIRGECPVYPPFVIR
jgi:CRISPR-associated protein Cas1